MVEADESDGTFLKLPADVAIVTNIDPEHLDHFKTFDAIKAAFRSFVENLPFYGFAVMCIDHPTVQGLVGQIEDRRVISYGENPQADVRLFDVRQGGGQTRFKVLIRDRKRGTETELSDLMLPMPGHHNALNATAAIAVAYELGVTPEKIREALAGFGGVKRRFTRTGEWNGATVFDDYGHHPVEIAAVLKAARAATEGQVIAVMQPHRYTRLQSLFGDFCTCFNDADAVIVAPVYAAASSRSSARAATISSPASGRPATARSWRWRARRRWRGWWRGSRSPATTSFASAPATSRNGPTRCRRRWRSSPGEATMRRRARTEARLVGRRPCGSVPFARSYAAAALPALAQQPATGPKPETIISALTTDINGDATLDRILLSQNEDGDGTLWVYLGKHKPEGGLDFHPPIVATAIVFAGTAFGQWPSLEMGRNGASLLVRSQNDAIGRTAWNQTLTIAGATTAWWWPA